MSPTNPYIVGNPVGNSSVFVGRADILQDVWRVVRDPQQNAIVLYGQRRIGKTSVLQELEAQLPKKGAYYPILFDLQNKAEWSLGRVLTELAQQISRFLKLVPADLGNEPETTFRQVWLPDVLNKLPSNASLVLLFDEFDVLANPDHKQAAAAFFPYLRALLNTNPILMKCVFAIGRNIDDLSSIALSLFRGVPAKHVSLLSYEETVRLIHLSQTNQTLNWSNADAVEKIWQLTNGHPFLTQALCSHIWDRLHNNNPNKPPTVTPKNVEEAIPETFSSRRNTLEWLWDGLPPAERVVASTLADAGARVITDTQLEDLLRQSGVQIIIRELQNAPRLLQEWDLIEPAEGGYRFRVELLRRWIAEYKLPQQAQSELDHLDPAADTLYKAGQELYRNRYWAVAVGPLRQAIGLNPHHLGANLLLADILLKDKNANEACEILEKLYTVRPSAAQTPLIQALLALAQSNNSEEEQQKLYERILKIDPKHPEAKRRKQEILKRREAEKQRRIKTIKGIYDKYSKRMWEFLGFSFALVVSYYWLTEFRGIPWYWVGTLLGAFWILLIKIVYAVKKRGVAPKPY
jgi:tetratricopeptide (TPR) repeat protein